MEVGLKLFLIYTLEMLVRALWKQSTYTIQLLLVVPSKAKQLILTHYKGCWRPFWQKRTYILQLLGTYLNAEYLHITIAIGASLNSRVLVHDHGRNFVVKCGGPAWCKTNIDNGLMRKWSFVNTDSQPIFQKGFQSNTNHALLYPYKWFRN